jgi:hypothetical protein
MLASVESKKTNVTRAYPLPLALVEGSFKASIAATPLPLLTGASLAFISVATTTSEVAPSEATGAAVGSTFGSSDIL